MKFPKLNFKLPKLTMPKHAKVALSVVIALALVASGAFLGFTVLIIGGVLLGIVAVYWPIVVTYLVAGGVLGAIVSHKHSGNVGPGIWNGLFYAFLTALVALLAIASYGVATGFR